MHHVALLIRQDHKHIQVLFSTVWVLFLGIISVLQLCFVRDKSQPNQLNQYSSTSSVANHVIRCRICPVPVGCHSCLHPANLPPPTSIIPFPNLLTEKSLMQPKASLAPEGLPSCHAMQTSLSCRPEIKRWVLISLLFNWVLDGESVFIYNRAGETYC